MGFTSQGFSASAAAAAFHEMILRLGSKASEKVQTQDVTILLHANMTINRQSVSNYYRGGVIMTVCVPA